MKDKILYTYKLFKVLKERFIQFLEKQSVSLIFFFIYNSWNRFTSSSNSPNIFHSYMGVYCVFVLSVEINRRTQGKTHISHLLAANSCREAKDQT